MKLPRLIQNEHSNGHRGHDRRAAKYEALIVVGPDCVVECVLAQGSYNSNGSQFLCDDDRRLVPEIETTVKDLISHIDCQDGNSALFTRLNGAYAIRISAMRTAGRKMYAIVIEADRSRDCIVRAAAKFELTSRQVDVLLHLLDGASAGEVANALKISEYTAQNYIKALLVKTSSRNRAVMIAKVLEWPGARVASVGSEIQLRRIAGV